MKVNHNGVFFAEWTGTLEELAEFSKLPVSELSWDANELAAAQREQFKASRAEQVAAIKVTTAAGNTFDGDERSQERMASSITALADGETVTWVLADNSVIQASRDELREALRLAGSAQAALWVQG